MFNIFWYGASLIDGVGGVNINKENLIRIVNKRNTPCGTAGDCLDRLTRIIIKVHGGCTNEM
jgi:hypothetical protein